MTAKLRVGSFLISALVASSAAALEPLIPIDKLHIERMVEVVGHSDMWLKPSADLADIQRQMSGLAAARGMATTGMVSPQGMAATQETGFMGPQVVYLEFNPGEPDFPVVTFFDGFFLGFWLGFPDYVYTQEDKDYIQARLEETYAEYDFQFVQEPPESGPFTTLTFGLNDTGNISFDFATGGLSILFGRAENIDFRNRVRDDNAFVDASFWQFLTYLDPTGNALAALSGIPVEDPSDIPEVVREAVLTQSSNTGAHELGHILGLRHHDSIGAPGFGLPPALPPEAYLPIGETEQNAEETYLHTMASGASVGLPIQASTTIDRFFGERSAVKLALNEVANMRAIPEAAAGGQLGLSPLNTPNPLVEGINAGLQLVTDASLIEGRISVEGEEDGYRFSGTQGQVFNAEVISWSDLNVPQPILAYLVLSRVESDGSLTELVANRLTFESFEPMIIDFELPDTGDYVLTVSSPATIDFGVDVPCPGGGTNPCPLSDFGLGGFEVGDYDLHAYFVDGR